MKVKMSGIGALPDLNIALNGLTVITGMNGTGKSTLLKAIYSVFQPSYAFESKKIVESIDLLREIIQSSLGLGAYSLNSGVDELMKQAKSIPDNRINDDDIQTRTFIEDLLNGKKNQEFYEMMIKRGIEIEFGSLSQFTNLRKGGKAIMEIVCRTGNCKCEVDSDNTRWDGATGRLPNIIYYDTPFVMDQPVSIPIMDDHRMILSKMIHDKGPNTILKTIGHSNRKNFDDAMTRVVGGNFTTGAKSYITPDGVEIDIRNMAAGMKVFAIMRILLEKRYLNSDSILLLDEPEIHLHPSWINILANAVVALTKDIGVKVVMTTHNPQLLMAIESVSKTSGVHTDYYNLSRNGNEISFNDVSEDLQPVYAEMAKPVIEVSERFLE